MPPMVPPAPPRLSTTTGWPNLSPTCAATGRAKMSFDPPGGNGTSQLMACVGQSAARSGSAMPAASRPPKAARRKMLIDFPLALWTRGSRLEHKSEPTPPHPEEHRAAMRLEGWATCLAVADPSRRGLRPLLRVRRLCRTENSLQPESARRHPLGLRALPQNRKHDGRGDAEAGEGNGDGAEDRGEQRADRALPDRQYGLGIGAAAGQVRRQPVAAGPVEGEGVDRAAAAIADRIARRHLGLDQLHLGARRVGRESQAEAVDIVRGIVAAVHRALLL